MGLKTLRGCLFLVILMMTATNLAKAQDTEVAQAAATCPGGVCPGLGNAFYLPDTNALSTNTGGTKIFKNTTLDKCAKFHSDIEASSRSLTTVKSMDEFVRSVSTQLSLGGSFTSNRMSVRASASKTTGTESSHTSTFHSATLDISQVFAAVDFNQDDECRGVGNLSPEFLRDFEALPLIDRQNAAEPSSWEAYVQFLRADGSHVMIKQLIGSRFQRWESSDSSESNLQTKLRARACAEVEGVEVGTNKPGWSASGCKAFSRDERASALRINTHEEKIIRGGSDEARKDLTKEVSPETINAFIDSGRLGNQAIGYAFAPIWGFLNRIYRTPCSQSGPGSPACQNLQRSRNLQAAYEGWLAIQCPLLRSENGVPYQEMRTTEKPDQLGIYSYQCWARKTGCLSHNDCNAFGAACYCYGRTCFDTGMPIDGTEEIRTGVRGSRSGGTRGGVNNSCELRGKCYCSPGWSGGLPDRLLYNQSSN
jgi:hypothetical protein